MAVGVVMAGIVISMVLFMLVNQLYNVHMSLNNKLFVFDIIHSTNFLIIHSKGQKLLVAN